MKVPMLYSPFLLLALSQENKQLLVKRPVGVPDEDTWNFTSTPIRDEDGEMLVEQLFISLDPAMRGWMNETRRHSSRNWEK